MSAVDLHACCPQIAGVYFPDPDAGADQAAVVVLFDVAPARLWRGLFCTRLAEIEWPGTVLDTRFAGETLTLLLRDGDARALAEHVRQLARQVSLDSARLHVMHGEAAESHAGIAPAEPFIRDPATFADPESMHALATVAEIMEAASRATGLRFVAVSRILDGTWTARAVYDSIEFGVKPGQQFLLEATLCNDVKGSCSTVAFDRADRDPVFSRSPLPSLYGFQSYISSPILTPSGEFFGTLCALDPEPAVIDAQVVAWFELFGRIIGHRLANDARTREELGELDPVS